MGDRAGACACVYCASPPGSTLPACVKLTHPDRSIAFWVWVTAADRDRFRLFKEHHGRYKQYKSFDGAIRDECQRRGRAVHDPTVVEGFARELKLGDGTLAKWDDVWFGLFSGASAVDPPSQIDTCECVEGVDGAAGVAGDAVTTMAELGLERVCPGRSGASRASTSTQRRSVRTKRARTTVHADPEAGAAVSSRAVLVDRERPPPSPSDEDEADRMQVSGPASYSLQELGGSRAQVDFVLANRPEWDQEAVDELIRWGARPKLHRVYRTFPGPHKTDVECVFVQPSGRLTDQLRGVPHRILQPLAWLRMRYPEQVSHL